MKGDPLHFFSCVVASSLLSVPARPALAAWRVPYEHGDRESEAEIRPWESHDVPKRNPATFTVDFGNDRKKIISVYDPVNSEIPITESANFARTDTVMPPIDGDYSSTKKQYALHNFDWLYVKEDGKHHIARDLNMWPGADETGDVDCGLPVRAIADGLVVWIQTIEDDAEDSWGNVMIVRHCIEAGDTKYVFDILFAHLRAFAPDIDVGESVNVSNVVGYVGNGNGYYNPDRDSACHLHWELRTSPLLPWVNSGTLQNPWVTDQELPTILEDYADPVTLLTFTGMHPEMAVQVSVDELRVRAEPGIDAEAKTSVKETQTGKIVEGPKFQDGVEWFRIDWENDTSGWSAAVSPSSYEPLLEATDAYEPMFDTLGLTGTAAPFAPTSLRVIQP